MLSASIQKLIFLDFGFWPWIPNEGPLLVHSAKARLKLVDGVQNWPFRIIIPKAFFCSAALHEYLSLSLERMKIFWHSENNVMHLL